MVEQAPTVVLLMGVSGSGKSTVGRLLAERIHADFVDGDDLHPPENVAKMRRGEALDDEDRQAWLDALRRVIFRALDSGRPLVAVSSALKERYRKHLKQPGEALRIVYLKGDFATIEARLKQRRGHFMPTALLRSQFEALEEPDDALTLSIERSPEELVREIVSSLALAGGRA